MPQQTMIFKWCVHKIAYNADILIMLLLVKDNVKIIFCFSGDISAFLKLYTTEKFTRKNVIFFFFLLISLFPFNRLWSVNIMKCKQMKSGHDRH